MAVRTHSTFAKRVRGAKPRPMRYDTRCVRKHILPAFAHLTVDAITVEHVKDWFAAMADRPGSAYHAMPVLSVMMRMAELWGYRPTTPTPARTPSDTGCSRRSGF